MTAQELIAQTVQEQHQGNAHVVVVNSRRFGDTRVLKPEDEVPDPDLERHLDTYIRVDEVL